MKNHIISICLLLGIVILLTMCATKKSLLPTDAPSRGKIIADKEIIDEKRNETIRILIYQGNHSTGDTITVQVPEFSIPNWFQRGTEGDWIKFKKKNGSPNEIDICALNKKNGTVCNEETKNSE